MYIPSFKSISQSMLKKVQKTVRWLGALLTPPTHPPTPPPPPPQKKKKKKWLWPIFGCKVGQSVPIGMKLELDVWHYLINVYTMFQIDISKHIEKAWKTSQNPKRAKIIAKIPKIRLMQKNELMSISIEQAICVPNLKNLPWFIRPRLQKLTLTYFWL